MPIDIEYARRLKLAAFTDDRYDGRLGFHQGGQAGVFTRLHAPPARHPEGCHLCMLQSGRSDLAKKCLVLRVGKRKSAFYVINAQFIEFQRNLQLVL